MSDTSEPRVESVSELDKELLLFYKQFEVYKNRAMVQASPEDLDVDKKTKKPRRS